MKSPDLLQIAYRWTPQARAFVPPLASVRQLNALVRHAAHVALFATLRSKRKSVFPALREQLGALPDRAFSLDVLWQDDEQIQALNASFRGKDRPTDVLSFPFWEGETLFEGAPLPLGDLVLSLETATRQAKELNHSLARELAFLTLHGTLHLLGFDHDTPSRRKTMFAWQDELLRLVPLSRFETALSRSESGSS